MSAPNPGLVDLARTARQAALGETVLEREMAASSLLIAVMQMHAANDVLTAEVVRLRAIEAGVRPVVSRTTLAIVRGKE